MSELSLEIYKINDLNIKFKREQKKLIQKHEYTLVDKEIRKSERNSKKEDRSIRQDIIYVGHLMTDFKEMKMDDITNELNRISTSNNLGDVSDLISTLEEYKKVNSRNKKIEKNEFLKNNDSDIDSNLELSDKNEDIGPKVVSKSTVEQDVTNNESLKKTGLLSKLKSFVTKYFFEIENDIGKSSYIKNEDEIKKEKNKAKVITDSPSDKEISQTDANFNLELLIAEKLKKLKLELSKRRKQKKIDSVKSLNDLNEKKQTLYTDMINSLNNLKKTQLESLKSEVEAANYNFFVYFANCLSISITQILDIADRFNIRSIDEFKQRSNAIIQAIKKERKEQEEWERQEEARRQEENAYYNSLYRRCRQCVYFSNCPMVEHITSPCPQFAPRDNVRW